MSPYNPNMPQTPEDCRRWCIDHATEDLRKIDFLIRRQRDILKLDSTVEKSSADTILKELLRIRATLKRDTEKWKFVNTASVLSGQTVSPIKVTFDTNVWRRLVTVPSQYPALKEKIVRGAISPFICQISISLESIPKADRHDFFKRYRPTINLTWEHADGGSFQGKLQIGPNNAAHPGLPPELLDHLVRARELGFKVIWMTNLMTVRSSEIPPDMLVKIDTTEQYWAYAQRLSDCSEFIKSIGCGAYHWDSIKQSPQPAPPKKAASAVAEWVDGDALSAHYSYGADVFCTSDRARSAGSKSIFYRDNLAKLQERFPIVVLGPEELLRYTNANRRF